MNSIKPLVHMATIDELKGETKRLFEEMKKGGGKVPKWMAVMANCPDILMGFFSLFKAVMDDTPVDKKLKWKVAFKISEINKCKFCVSVSKMKLKQFGFSDKQVDNLKEGTNSREKTALEFAEASSCHAYNIDEKLIAKMKKHFTDKEIVELTSVVGLFNFINRFNDTLNVLPE